MQSRQVCERCGHKLSELAPDSVCPKCSGLLELRHRFVSRGDALRDAFASRRQTLHGPDVSGVWRYRELVLPSATPSQIVSHPEGNTPLLERGPVSAWASIERLLMKHEGHNPTGSFKDRGMTVAMTQARRLGARAVACASTGNTSASLAAYAAQAGLPALVFVPAGQVAMGKLTQTLAYGAKTLIVRGNFDDCLTLARDASAALNIQLLNSINPFRLEGQKSIVLEMLEQLDWSPPDWIVLPAGNLGNTSAFGKAIREAVEVGLISHAPRIAAIQAAGAAPFAQSFHEHFEKTIRVTPETVATAIRIGAPASWDRAVRAIRETNGVVASVTDEEILEAKAIIDTAGVGCEPASAASVAGVRKLRAEGVIGSHDAVVSVLTGNLLKDPGILVKYHQETEPAPRYANRPIEIEPSVGEVERIIRANYVL
jgi:threonine synthase